jgi:retinol dehydrogenase-12
VTDATSMQGKVCLVTGATSGIGLVAARELAARGATVVLVGRSRERSAAAAAAITSQTGNQNVSFMLADLSSQRAVRELAAQFRAAHERLHVLVNNAGAVFMRRERSADGIEMTWALNHLAYFLLTDLLLDTLKASAPARIISVSSDAHKGGRIDFDDPQRPGGFRAYSQSKLANILFTRELARRLEGTGVTANTLHPGVVATNFGVNNGWIARALRPLLNLASISAEEGAKTIVYLATSPEVAGVSGEYFYKCRVAPTDQAARDASSAERLWALSEQMTTPRP